MSKIPAADWILIFLSLLVFRPVLQSDGLGYYAFLPSLILDHDLNLSNQLAGSTESWTVTFADSPNKNGYIMTTFPLGTAFSWLPGFLTGSLAARLLTWIGYPLLNDGFDRICRLYALSMSPICILLGFHFIRKSMRPFFSGKWIETTLVILLLGTPLLYYGTLEPDYSHHFDFLLVAWLCWSLRPDKFRDISHATLFRLGAGTALIAVNRMQNIGWIFIPLLALAWDNHFRSGIQLKNFLRRTASIILGVVTVGFPQLLYWYIVHGNAVNTGYQNRYFLFWPIHFFRVLISTNKGLFAWHPAVILAIAGFFLIPEKAKRQVFLCLLGVAWATYMSSSVIDWNGGGCFGARRFVGSLPVIAWGIAALLNHIRVSLIRILIELAVAITIFWNTALLLLYRSAGITTENLIPYLVSAQDLHLAGASVMDIITSGYLADASRTIRGILTSGDYSPLTPLLLLAPAGIWFFVSWISNHRKSGEEKSGLRDWLQPRVIVATSAVFCIYMVTLDATSKTTAVLNLKSGCTALLKCRTPEGFCGGYGRIQLPFEGRLLTNNEGELSASVKHEIHSFELPLQSALVSDCVYLLVDTADFQALGESQEQTRLLITNERGEESAFWIKYLNPISYPRYVNTNNDYLLPVNPQEQTSATLLEIPLGFPVKILKLNIDRFHPNPSILHIYGIALHPLDPELESSNINYIQHNRLLSKIQINAQECSSDAQTKTVKCVNIGVKNQGPSKEVDLYLALKNSNGSSVYYDLNKVTDSPDKAVIQLFIPAHFEIEGCIASENFETAIQLTLAFTGRDNLHQLLSVPAEWKFENSEPAISTVK